MVCLSKLYQDLFSRPWMMTLLNSLLNYFLLYFRDVVGIVEQKLYVEVDDQAARKSKQDK